MEQTPSTSSTTTTSTNNDPWLNYEHLTKDELKKNTLLMGKKKDTNWFILF